MVSQLHFGHYKAAAQDNDLSEAHAIILGMVTRMGISLPCWQYGLTVVLEKKPGCLLIKKLRAILLMDAAAGKPCPKQVPKNAHAVGLGETCE